MRQEQIDRINELYRKSKAEGLTAEEKKEQDILRKQFVADVVNEDGTVENLGEKYGKKKSLS